MRLPALFLRLTLAPHSLGLYKSFNNLMKEADGVISGHVVSVNSQYDAKRELYTFLMLHELEVLSGSYQDWTLTTRLKSGKVDNHISHVIGSPARLTFSSA